MSAIGTKRTSMGCQSMSAFDAVDGSSTGTGVPWMWVLIRPHDSEEPSHASDYDHRSRHCEVSFPGSRRRCEGQCGASPPDQAALRSGVLPEAAAVPGWHRSLCLGASLVAPTASAWPHRSPDAAGLRDALCEAA